MQHNKKISLKINLFLFAVCLSLLFTPYQTGTYLRQVEQISSKGESFVRISNSEAVTSHSYMSGELADGEIRFLKERVNVILHTAPNLLK